MFHFQWEIKWLFQRYHELVGTSKRVTVRYENRIRGAIGCSGDFQIHPEAKQFKVNPSVWSGWDQEKRNRYFYKFISPPLPKDPKIVSQCGQYEMSTPGRVQRKPHQMVTPRNERATTKKALKKATASIDKDIAAETCEQSENDFEQTEPTSALGAFIAQDNILQGKFGQANKKKAKDQSSGTPNQRQQTPKRGRGRPRKSAQANKENKPK